MSKKYLKVKNLPWNTDVESNIFDYPDIKNKDNSNSAMIYHFTADKNNLHKGMGVLEMQMKIAHIFRHNNFDLYKKYFMENDEYREALTKGIYGPKTTELIMQFQKHYMKNHFKGNWDPKKGFGSFGENTRKTLENRFQRLRRKLSREGRLRNKNS